MVPPAVMVPPAICTSRIGDTVAFACITPKDAPPKFRLDAVASASESDVAVRITAPVTVTLPLPSLKAFTVGEAVALANGNCAEISPPPEESAMASASL